MVCEEKHMGSRAVVVVCRDEEVARKRFGVTGAENGVCVTRTGRRFFTDAALETGLLARVRAAFEAADLWRKLETDWACLDCELMPWSVKAQELLRSQYAALGSAATPALAAAVTALTTTADSGLIAAPPHPPYLLQDLDRPAQIEVPHRVRCYRGHFCYLATAQRNDAILR